jgi:hypothetical protein
MDWEITIHENPRYLEVSTNGMADNDSSFDMVKAITENMKKQRITRVLIDHRKIESVEGKIIDIYDRPKKLKIFGALLKIKIAEIIKPEHIDHFRFLETVCINQGYKFSIFHEKEKAEKWLLNE